MTGTTTVDYDGQFEVRGSVYSVWNGGDLPVVELEIDGVTFGPWQVAPADS